MVQILLDQRFACYAFGPLLLGVRVVTFFFVCFGTLFALHAFDQPVAWNALSLHGFGARFALHVFLSTFCFGPFGQLGLVRLFPGLRVPSVHLLSIDCTNRWSTTDGR